jgi:hypothetical protein
MPNLPKDLAVRLRDAGLTVKEIEGWRLRGRPASTGGFDPVGVLNHHTGSRDEIGDFADDLAYAKWLFTIGRDDLPAPLCHLSLSLEGVVYLGAAGRANHAGAAKSSGSVAGGDGNTLYVGIEWMLSGTQIIPPKMMAAGVTLNAVLLDVLGSSEQAVSCHYQTSVTGKWDIGDPNGIPFNGHKVLDVNKFRAAVKKRTESLYPEVEPVQVQVIKRAVLTGTIDGHDPLLVTFRIKGPEGWFRLTVVCVNWGRGYTPKQFLNNVNRVIDKTEEKHYVVLLLQEIDEADLSPEHKVIRGEVPAGSTFVEWGTREPIIVWPGIPVRRERKVMTMDQGSEIGAPKGTGPRRFFVSCVTLIEGVRIGFGNQHPHRVDRDWSKKDQAVVAAARKRGEMITKREVGELVELCDLTIHGGDMNDLNYPKSHPKEQVALEHGLDTIRYIVA